MEKGDFVTAKVKGKKDTRQGIFVNRIPEGFIVLEESGAKYKCEGEAIIIPDSNLWGSTKNFVLNYRTNHCIIREDQMKAIITSIKVFDKNCFGCVKHKRQVMIAYDDIDIFLTQEQAKGLIDDLIIVTKCNEAKIAKGKYIVKGNHPTLKYVNLEINRLSKLPSKIGKLLANGYEVNINLQPEQINKPESLGDILRSAMEDMNKSEE